jgi:type IV pilus assembly protein PilO
MALSLNDPQQRNKLLAGVLPLLLLGGYWYFYHGDRQDEITALEERFEQLDTKNAAARARAQQGGPDLEKKLALYEAQIIRLEELVPKSEEVPQLLHDLALRAQENGVELARMKPNEESAGAFYTLQTYDLAVFGGYHNIGRFLTAVGSLPRIVTPYDLKVQPRAEKDRSGAVRVQAEFRIKTYVLPPATPVAAEERRDARS